jgi:hypothetical protein
MKKWSSGILIVFCLLAVSCTVTKRHYRKGFHVQWHHALPERIGNGEEQVTEAVAAEDQNVLFDTLEQLAMVPPAMFDVEDPAFQAQRLVNPVQDKTPNPFLVQLKSFSPSRVPQDLPLHRHAFAPVQPYLFSTGVEVPGKQEADQSLLFGILALCLFVFLFFPALIFGIPAIESGRLARDRNRDQDEKVTKRARTGIVLGRIALCLVFAVLVAAFIGLVCGFFAVYASAEAAILALTFLCIGAFLVGILLALMTWIMIRYVF